MIETWLNRRWYGGSAPVALRPFAWLFAGAVRARRTAYQRGWRRTYRVGMPVVVVGNLTVGGTGKTPLTLWLASRLGERGIKVGVVSRGYGRDSAEVRVLDEHCDWREVGDEPLLLYRRTHCLVAVARDRVAAARTLIELGAELILADDGLQHLRLARDCEIAVVDGSRGVGNGQLLPAGPLREPPSRLRTVDAVVVNGALQDDSWAGAASLTGEPLLMRLVAGAARHLVSGETRALETFRGGVHAVAGIGHPQRFYRELTARGLETIPHPFPDHHAFTAADLDFGDALPVLMTEKDAVKCAGFSDPRLWCVPVEAHFSEADEKRLLALVMRKIAPSPHSPIHPRG